VRTLYQDSWGELTHEDTYSKSGELPPLVEVLSTRMADLLATLDDIAEDLRNELDRIDEAIVTETAGQPDADILLERWRSLDRPLEISSLAWALQNEFGAEVSDNWFGHGTFKRFLHAAVPEGELSGDRQVYLLPAGSAAGASHTERADDDADPVVTPANSAESTAASRWSKPPNGVASTNTSPKPGVASVPALRRPGWSTNSPGRLATEPEPPAAR
jgi:hypothetical protein